MRKLIPYTYFQVLKQKDFFVLIVILAIGQMATSFLLLSLVSSVFTQTRSNFGVSGVVLSLSIPAFFLMAIGGVIADLADRKKIIIVANAAIALVVLLITIWLQYVFAAILLAFIYFAINSFFIPAASAASAQVVKKSQLMAVNSVFVFTLSALSLFGFFVAAIVHFFFGNVVTLIVCEILLVIAVLVSFLLPSLPARGNSDVTISGTLKDIAKTIKYIFHSRTMWFFALIFAFIQGVMSFAATLAPGFFDQVIGISINKSPILILPLVGIGIVVGTLFVHKPHIKKSLFIAIGLWILGFISTLVGVVLYLDFISSFVAIFLVLLFMVVAGFGVIVVLIPSRTILQEKVAHNFQGTMFGALSILSGLFASVMSPLAAFSQSVFGYLKILILMGVVLMVMAYVIRYIGKKWNY